MAVVYHLTPEGPRRCSVDPSNPNSGGCKYEGGMHFDRFDDAMEVYTENLKETFGEFHVLVRPTVVEQARRLGYRSLDGIETVKANPQVQAAVENLRTAASKARAGLKELRPGKPAPLPESVETVPLEELVEPEELEQEAATVEIFDSGREESLADFASRITRQGSSSSFSLPPLDQDRLDRSLAILERAELIRKMPPQRKGDRFRAYRSSVRRRVSTAASRAEAAATRAVVQGTSRTGRSLVSAGYAVRATASVAKDAAALRTMVATARVQDGARSAAAAATTAGRNIQQRAARMSLPAGHIRPGDTFDGTTVRGVESLDDGRVKISYQVKAGSPVLATTVAGDRSMLVDRKTRRQARNSRISSSAARPIARTRALSQRVARASSEQLALLRPVLRQDVRFGSIERSIRQHERDVRQRELIEKLRRLRSNAQDRVFQ